MDVERSAIEVLSECERRWHGNLWKMLTGLSVQIGWVRKIIGETCHPEDRRLVTREVILRSWADAEPDLHGPDEFHRALPSLLKLASCIMPCV